VGHPFAQCGELLGNGSPAEISADPHRGCFTKPPRHGAILEKANHRASERSRIVGK